jgi:hypothetical protein
MGRFFDNRQEMEDAIEQGTNPNAPLDEQMLVALGGAGQTVAHMLGLRVALQELEKEFLGGTDNEVHDLNTSTRMREPMAMLRLAIDEVVKGAKDVTWQAETCTCKRCRGADRARASKYN